MFTKRFSAFVTQSINCDVTKLIFFCRPNLDTAPLISTPGSRASLGNGLSLRSGKTSAAVSSDTWDCDYRSSHRRALAFPAGVDCPLLQSTIIISPFGNIVLLTNTIPAKEIDADSWSAKSGHVLGL